MNCPFLQLYNEKQINFVLKYILYIILLFQFLLHFFMFYNLYLAKLNNYKHIFILKNILLNYCIKRLNNSL
jgi:O-antigen ligase